MRFELRPNNCNEPDEVILSDLRAVAKKLRRSTLTIRQYRDAGARFHPTTVINRFGSWYTALAAASLSVDHLNFGKLRHDSDQDLDILGDLQAVAKNLHTLRLTKQQYVNSGGRFSPGTIIRRFGRWNRAIAEAGLKVEHRNAGIPKDEAIQDLKAVAASLDRETITIKDYEKHGKWSSGPLLRHFRSWFDALEAAGLEPSRTLGVTEEQLFSNLERMWRDLGRQPYYREVRKPFSRYAAGTYAGRFGSWRRALEAFVEDVSSESYPPVPDTVHRDALASVPTSQPKRPTTSRDVNYRLRWRVLDRDGHRCKLCGASPANEPGVKLQIDHVVPWSRGGETTLDNLQTACQRCNLGKGDCDPKADG